jgi:undecaprenyl diphosphate synthase
MASPEVTHEQPALAAEGGALPRHVAIIMDGNGRWATMRGLSRTEGHKMGVEAVRRIVRHVGDLGIGTLTLFSFSAENWRRPPDEVRYLMGLLKLFIRRDLADLHARNVCIRVVGDRSSMPADILKLLEDAEVVTQANTSLTLVIAFNYGARQEIVQTARRLAARVAAGEIHANDIDAELFAQNLDTAGLPDPDLVIRTSGEMRISNFLLWQAAYAEFVFAPVCWPDFDEAEFDRALNEFKRRDRRFGGLVARAGG